MKKAAVGIVALPFVNRGAVVCSACDFPEKPGDSIDFEGVITYDEGAAFDAAREDGVVRPARAKTNH